MNIFCPEPCITCDPIPLGGEGIFPNPNSEANPFVNLSSEAPDIDLFIRFKPGPTGPTIGLPPLGQPWTASGCVGICFSSVSQADADRCAANQSVLCIPIIWPLNPDPVACALNPDACKPVPPPVFFNTAQSCAAFCYDGTPFTYFVAAGQYSALNQASANAIAFSEACRQAELQKMCLGNLSDDGACQDEFYRGNMAVSTLSPSVTLTMISGPLPPGLFFAQTGPKTGSVSGTPTASGNYPFTIQARSPSGIIVNKQYSIIVAAIVTSSPLPDGSVGQAYSYTLTGNGTTGTIHWFISGGQLPSGLSLNELTGEVSGTPTTEETQGFTVEMRDDLNDCLKQFTITVESTGLHFDTLVWTEPYAFEDISEIPVGPPADGSWLGADWSNDVSTGAPNTYVSNRANLTTTTDLINCNLHLDIGIFDGDPGFTDCHVQIFQDSVLIRDVFISAEAPAVGSYDFPFVISAGVNTLIEIYEITSCFQFTHVQYSATLTPL